MLMSEIITIINLFAEIAYLVIKMKTLLTSIEFCVLIKKLFVMYLQNRNLLNGKKNHEKLPNYITIRADSECRNEPIENIDHNLKTKNLYQQKPVCSGDFVINKLENKDYLNKQEYYKAPFGKDYNKWFVDQINKIEKSMFKIFNSKPSNNIKTIENKDKCWLCEEDFGGQAQIQHYCKLPGKYLGNSHNQCIHKAEARNKNHFVHVLFHNLEGYDSHIFVNDLINNSENKKIIVIPHTNEKFMSITYGCNNFLDSLKFLGEKLDNCTNSLKDGNFIFLKEQFRENYHLFTKKIAYPYDYFETLEGYEKNINLLTEKDYYSKLNKEMPSSEEIQRTT